MRIYINNLRIRERWVWFYIGLYFPMFKMERIIGVKADFWKYTCDILFFRIEVFGKLIHKKPRPLFPHHEIEIL